MAYHLVPGLEGVSKRACGQITGIRLPIAIRLSETIIGR